jgi:hypothetical protein
MIIIPKMNILTPTGNDPPHEVQRRSGERVLVGPRFALYSWLFWCHSSLRVRPRFYRISVPFLTKMPLVLYCRSILAERGDSQTRITHVYT